MANVEINDLTAKTTPADTDELELQETSGGSSKKITRANLLKVGVDVQGVVAEGVFADGDKTKLDGIETAADVTDTANVTAAGALMDSEVDADIKTLALPASTTISTFGASLVDDAAASNARTTLGVVIGTDVLAEQTIGIADDNLLEVDGSPNDDEYARFTANGLEGRTEAEFKADFNLEIGTDVQAYDADTTKNDVANTFTADQTFSEETNHAKDLVLTESADHTSTPGAGFGYLWCKNTAPSTLIFTDDTGADTSLGGGGSSDAADLEWANGTQSEVTDAADAVAFEYDTDNALSTSGAKLASWSNNGTEKAYIDTDGAVYALGQKYYGSGSAYILMGSSIGLYGNVTVNDNLTIDIATATTTSDTETSLPTIYSKNRILFGRQGASLDSYVGVSYETSDDPQGDLVVYGSNAYASASTNLVGGGVAVTGGAGASASAGDAHGGNVVLSGGTGYGTGHNGYVLISNIPTSDPGVSGALWSDSGTIKISA